MILTVSFYSKPSVVKDVPEAEICRSYKISKNKDSMLHMFIKLWENICSVECYDIKVHILLESNA